MEGTSPSTSQLLVCVTDADVRNRVPKIGMQFGSKETAQAFYSDFGKLNGFGTKVRRSWKSRDGDLSKLLYSCNRAGTKKVKEHRRYDGGTSLTDCMARMRIKRIDPMMWEVTEVVLEHNHELCNPSEPTFLKSISRIDVAAKKKLMLNAKSGTKTTKAYQTSISDIGECENSCVDQHRAIKPREEDLRAIQKFFCSMQIKNPSFFYLMDLDREGRLHNVFWADARSRISYTYFGDVVTVDTTYLRSKYNLPFALFIGVNHHGQSVLFGCGLLADETTETFIWLFKSWLSCMSNHPPNVIVTDQCNAIKDAVREVFPNAHHRLCLWHIMKVVPGKLGSLKDYRLIKEELEKSVYDSLRMNEFECTWKNMIASYDLADHEWLKVLYELRDMWVPVFVKNAFYAGIFMTKPNESFSMFFDGYVHQRTTLKEFFEQYEVALHKKIVEEAESDFTSFNTRPYLKTAYSFEKQISELYTRDMFKRFQEQVWGIANCFSLSELSNDGTMVTYRIKERIVAKDGTRLEPKEYEVQLINSTEAEVNCICGLFCFKGILCRHALYALNHNGVDQIPSQYILSRWRKDFKRIHIRQHGSTQDTAASGSSLYDSLFQKAVKCVEEGAISEDIYKIASEQLDEVLTKIRTAFDYKYRIGETSYKTAHCSIEPANEQVNGETGMSSSILCGPQCMKTGGRSKGKRQKSFEENPSNSKRKSKSPSNSSKCIQNQSSNDIVHVELTRPTPVEVGNTSLCPNYHHFGINQAGQGMPLYPNSRFGTAPMAVGMPLIIYNNHQFGTKGMVIPGTKTITSDEGNKP